MLSYLRRAFQFIGLFGANSYFNVLKTKVIYRGNLKGICLPLLNCYACPLTTFSCPIGTLQHFSAKHKIPFYVLGYLSLIGIVLGRMACGWICPFGLFQDLLWKLKIKKLTLPKYLPNLKYIVLIVLVFMMPFITGDSWFSRICPWGTLEAAIPWGIWNPEIWNPNTGNNAYVRDLIGWLYGLKITILIIFMGLMLFYKRIFCRVLCPLGALFSLFNRFSVFRMRVDDSCTECGRCHEICPIDIKVYENPNQADCIRCLKCTDCKHVHFENIFSIEKLRKPKEIRG